MNKNSRNFLSDDILVTQLCNCTSILILLHWAVSSTPKRTKLKVEAVFYFDYACTAFKKSWLITKKKNYKSFVNNNFKFKKEYVSLKFYTGWKIGAKNFPFRKFTCNVYYFFESFFFFFYFFNEEVFNLTRGFFI